MSVLPQVGDTFTTPLYNNEPKSVKVLAVHSFGTMDVEVLATGKCYRITGLDYILEHDPLNLLS